MALRRSACENCYRLKVRCVSTSGAQCKSCSEKNVECVPRLKLRRQSLAKLDAGLQEIDNLESVFIEPYRWSCLFQDCGSTTLDYYASISLVGTYFSLGIFQAPTGLKWVLMALYHRAMLENAVNLLHSITTLALEAQINLEPVMGCCKVIHQQHQDHHRELKRRLDEFGGPCVMLSLNMGRPVVAVNEQYHTLFECNTSLSHRITHSRDWWTKFMVDKGFINGIASDCFASFFLNAEPRTFFYGEEQRVDWRYTSPEATLLRDRHNRYHRVFIAIQISVSDLGESLYVLYGFIFVDGDHECPEGLPDL
mmetsp:Transcript_15315/g.24935  ORF Transcript_15315/g.24935 Transcript_15315/m.24935 type:complete len:309 (+) Transcript_15315:373-1299(+)